MSFSNETVQHTSKPTDPSEDRLQRKMTAESEWTIKEERVLGRNLDNFRILFLCRGIYCLEYVDRGSLGNVKVIGADTSNSLEQLLGWEGTKFNWAVIKRLLRL